MKYHKLALIMLSTSLSPMLSVAQSSPEVVPANSGSVQPYQSQQNTLKTNAVPANSSGLQSHQLQQSTLKTNTAPANNSGFQLTDPLRPSHFVLTLSGGAAFAQLQDSSSSTNAINGKTNTYTSSNNWQAQGLFGVFAGVHYPFYRGTDQSWDVQLGVGYYQPGAISSSGTNSQTYHDMAALYNYNYQIQSRQVLLESKLLTTLAERYHPYIDVGLGDGINRASYYNVTPANATAGPGGAVPFAGNTQQSFSYMLGLGVDIDIIPSLRAGIGYRFSDLGSASLKDSAIPASTSAPLKQNNLYVQEILVQLSYLF